MELVGDNDLVVEAVVVVGSVFYPNPRDRTIGGLGRFQPGHAARQCGPFSGRRLAGRRLGGVLDGLPVGLLARGRIFATGGGGLGHGIWRFVDWCVS